jgi:sRNA-binding protein
LAFLLPMEAAADGIDWMLDHSVQPLIMLRNSIVPHSVIAQNQFAQADSRSHDEASAAAEEMEADVIESRKERKEQQKRELKAKCAAHAFDTKVEGGSWENSPTDLETLRRKSKFKIDDLRRPLIAGTTTLLVKPSKGTANAIFIRQNPNFDLAAALAAMANPPAPAEAAPAEAAPAEAAPAEAAGVVADEDIDVWGSSSDDDVEVEEGDADDGEFTVLKIIGQDQEDPNWFMVKWLNGEETLEPSRNLTQCWTLVEEYLQSQKPQMSKYELAIQNKREENQRVVAELAELHAQHAVAQAAEAEAVTEVTEDQAEDQAAQAAEAEAATEVTKEERQHRELAATRATMETPPALTPQASASTDNRNGMLDSELQADLDMMDTLGQMHDPATPAAASKKRPPVSPAEGSPTEEQVTKVRSSPRFSRLPGAAQPPALKIGDRVRAIYRYKEGGVTKYPGEIVDATPDNGHFTVHYNDGDVEEGVPRAVIALVSDKVLDKSPPK